MQLRASLWYGHAGDVMSPSPCPASAINRARPTRNSTTGRCPSKWFYQTHGPGGAGCVQGCPSVHATRNSTTGRCFCGHPGTPIDKCIEEMQCIAGECVQCSQPGTCSGPRGDWCPSIGQCLSTGGLASLLNNQSVAPTSAAGYSLVHVQGDTKECNNSLACLTKLQKLLAPHVQIVGPSVLAALVRRHVLKTDDELIKTAAIAQHEPTTIKTDDTMSLPPQIKTPPGIKCNDPDVANAACFGFNPTDSTVAVRAALATNRSKIVIPKMSGPWIVGPMGGPAAMHLLHQKDMTIVLEPGVEIQAKRGDFHLKNQRLLLIEDCSNITILAYGSTMSMWRQDYANLTMYSKSEWRAGLAIYDSQHLKLLGLNISRTGGDGMTLTDVRNVYVKDAQLLNNYRQGPSLPKSLTLSK